MKKNIFSNERNAISPIIATLLLILIAIAAGVVVYAYVLGFVGNTTTGQPSGQTNITSDSQSLKASTGSIQFILKNVGGKTATIGNGLYIQGGSLPATQIGWQVSLTSTSGSPTSITDIQVQQVTDNSHVKIIITQVSGTVTYTATFLNSGLSCTITISSSTTGSCSTNIALPSGVTVSSGYVADTGTIAKTPGAGVLTLFGVSTNAGAGTGSLSVSPQTTVETDMFAIGSTPLSVSAGTSYTIQIVTNDGSTATFPVRAS
jgi:flagellin-like protein